MSQIISFVNRKLVRLGRRLRVASVIAAIIALSFAVVRVTRHRLASHSNHIDHLSVQFHGNILVDPLPKEIKPFLPTTHWSESICVIVEIAGPTRAFNFDQNAVVRFGANPPMKFITIQHNDIIRSHGLQFGSSVTVFDNNFLGRRHNDKIQLNSTIHNLREKTLFYTISFAQMEKGNLALLRLHANGGHAGETAVRWTFDDRDAFQHYIDLKHGIGEVDIALWLENIANPKGFFDELQNPKSHHHHDFELYASQLNALVVPEIRYDLATLDFTTKRAMRIMYMLTRVPLQIKPPKLYLFFDTPPIFQTVLPPNIQVTIAPLKWPTPKQSKKSLTDAAQLRILQSQQNLRSLQADINAQTNANQLFTLDIIQAANTLAQLKFATESQEKQTHKRAPIIPSTATKHIPIVSVPATPNAANRRKPSLFELSDSF